MEEQQDRPGCGDADDERKLARASASTGEGLFGRVARGHWCLLSRPRSGTRGSRRGLRSGSRVCGYNELVRGRVGASASGSAAATDPALPGDHTQCGTRGARGYTGFGALLRPSRMPEPSTSSTSDAARYRNGRKANAGVLSRRCAGVRALVQQRPVSSCRARHGSRAADPLSQSGQSRLLLPL